MKLLAEFRKFALRGSLIDMAVGFTVGAAFTTVARSLVDNIIMPVVGLVLGSADFSEFFVVLEPGPKVPPPYMTLEAAEKAGAVTLNYGLFVNSIIALLLVALAMFIIIRVVNRAEATLEARFGDAPVPGEPTEKKCPYCRSTIAIQATRCPFCTSQLTDELGEG